MAYDSLRSRMKQYEAASQIHLTTRMPVIIRIDGLAFHVHAKYRTSLDPLLKS